MRAQSDRGANRGSSGSFSVIKSILYASVFVFMCFFSLILYSSDFLSGDVDIGILDGFYSNEPMASDLLNLPVDVSAASLKTKKRGSEDWEFGLIHYPVKEAFNGAYPAYDKLQDLIEGWNPDDPRPPRQFTESLQHFNYSNLEERALALEYRDAEIPFKVYDVPEFAKAGELWNDAYLSKQLKDKRNQHIEKSKNNHFMYWSLKNWKNKIESFVPPTEFVNKEMSFAQWVKLAHKADELAKRNGGKEDTSETEHYYFMSNAMPKDRGKTFIARDLPSFSSGDKNFFISRPVANKGIQCRFGMRGIIAEAHYDSGRNMIAMIHGAKRYILNPPTECSKLDLIKDTDHPSYRHSTIDWSSIQEGKKHDFYNVKAIDTIVRQGEVLYVPSFWTHYIISLKYSVQCNSRSGPPPNGIGADEIESCMGLGGKYTTKKSGLGSY